MLKIPVVGQLEEECASACLTQVLNFYEDPSTQEEVIDYCGSHFRGRDWDYLLGSYALTKGFKAAVHTRSLSVFDSTWFNQGHAFLEKKLEEIKGFFREEGERFIGYKKLESEAQAALRFLKLGGDVKFCAFSKELIESYLKENVPVIATFTAQLLFRLPKDEDDIKGEPWKHTVVISGAEENKFYITDPGDFQENSNYSANADVMLDAISRYDSNLLIIKRS